MTLPTKMSWRNLPLAWVVIILLGGSRSVQARGVRGQTSPTAAPTLATFSASSSSDDPVVHVLIGVKNNQGVAAVKKAAAAVRPKFKQARAVAAAVPQSQLAALYQDPNVLYIEEDIRMFQFATHSTNTPSSRRSHRTDLRTLASSSSSSSSTDVKATTYGPQMIQADEKNLGNMASMPSACNDTRSFKIGVVDSGLAIENPGIPCRSLHDPSSTNCIGSEFGLDEGQLWYNPQSNLHGTHVTGIIAGRANRLGQIGLIGDGQVCIIMARVFGDDNLGASLSDVFAGLEWVIAQGARVINLSLGAPTSSQTAQQIVTRFYHNGGLLVAASGNSGSSELNYPASYETVISVAAVDRLQERATFSEYNQLVDLAAPGVDILSTVIPGMESVAVITSPTIMAGGNPLGGSVHPGVNGTSGVVVECSNLGQSTCPGPGGHICLIERGTITFEQKTLNCQAGGGIAALIYNIDPRLFKGTMQSPTQTTIPAVAISSVDGQSLKDTASSNSVVSITISDLYGFESGTSMAAPEVTGAISLIWRACPKCKNTAIESCLTSTALDLGTTGKDVYYGHGLVQVNGAYKCLVNQQKCC